MLSRTIRRAERALRDVRRAAVLPLLAVGASCAPTGSGAAVEAASAAPSAFAGAQGWAAATRGGAGGRVIRVTTLEATGPGSFSEAVAVKGPRTVVFEVGGVIDLGGKVVRLTEPFLTIAGQTAPSPGITFVRGGIGIATHDVVIRHIRLRAGEAGHAKGSGWEVDGIATSGGDAYNVVVDHCSISWATDENLSASGPRFEGEGPAGWRQGTSRRITFSNNIVAEALSRSTHAKGEHSKGTLIHDNVTDVLIVGSLYAGNVERNPLFKGGARGAVVNNLIYNPGRRAVHYNLLASEWGENPYQTGQITLVGNVLRHGPDTAEGTPLLFHRGEGDLEFYAEDNRMVDRAGRPVPLTAVDPKATGRLVRVEEKPTWPAGLRPLPVESVEEHVLRTAGARPWDRDEVDQRIVREVREGRGRIIDSEREVGGYPSPSSSRRPYDPATLDR